MPSKIQGAFRVIVSISIALWMVYNTALFNKPILNPVADAAILFGTTLVSYELLSALVFKLLDDNALFQKLIWGRKYLGGFWVFTSHPAPGQTLMGIWRVDQSLDGVKVVGFGLDSEFGRRTRVHSVSPLSETNNLYEIVNRRNDWDDTDRPLLSVSTFAMDAPVPHGLFRYSDTLRGETAILGGPRDGLVLKNVVWRRCLGARTEEDAITFARKLASERRPATVAEPLRPEGSALPA